MKTRKDGTKPTKHGPGVKTDSMPMRGPGPSASRKSGLARPVENKRK